MNDEDTQNLIIAAKNGDPEAFGKLYELYFVPIYRYIYFRVKHKEEAEDLTQAVFAKVYSSIARYEYTGKSPLAYFYTAARNALIDHWRKHKRIINLEPAVFEQVEDVRANAEDYTAGREELQGILRALKKLGPEQEEVITLKFINELSNKEIEEILSKSEDAVRQIQHRALVRLRAIYYGQSI